MHYVKWSWLSSMASIMWVALIAQDWYLGNKIKNNTEYYMQETIELSKESVRDLKNPSDASTRATLTDSDEGGRNEEIIQSNPDIFKQFTISNFNMPVLTTDILHESSASWIARFWNVVAFIMSVASCILIRAALNYLLTLFWKTRVSCISSAPPAISMNELKAPPTTKSATRIPTLQIKKSEDHFEKHHKDPIECINIISTEISRELIEYKQKLTNQEEANQRLIQDLLVFKEEKNFEIENLNRKLDTITNQKRELSKQLAVAQEENRQAKEELKEMYHNKVDLNKRLENLQREARLLQKTKRLQARQLEALKNENDSLKNVNDTLLRDKTSLQKRISKLETSVGRLKIAKNNSNIQVDKMTSSSEPIRVKEKPEKLCENVTNIDNKPNSIDLLKLKKKSPSLKDSVDQHLDSSAERNFIDHSYEENVNMWINGQRLVSQKASIESVHIQGDGVVEISDIFQSCLDYSTGSASNYVTSQASSRLQNGDDGTYLSSATSVSLTDTSEQNKLSAATELNDTDINESSENSDFEEFWARLQLSSSNVEIPEPEKILQKYCTKPEVKFLCDYLKGQKKEEINRNEHKNCFDGEVTRLAVCRDVSSRITPRLSYPGESIPLEQLKHSDSINTVNNNSSQNVLWSQRFLSNSPVFKNFLQNLNVSNENEQNCDTPKKEKSFTTNTTQPEEIDLD